MKKSEFQAEKLIILFYFIINLCTFIIITSSSIYIGDPAGEYYTVPLDIAIILFISNTAIYYLLYLIYRCCVSHIAFHNEVIIKRIETLLFLGVTIALLGFFWIDYGRAEYQSTSPFGFVFRLIPYSVIWLLYVSINSKWNAKSIFLIVYYVAAKIIMGWSGILLALFWVLFIKYYNAKKRSFLFMCMCMTLLVILYFSAPVVYYLKYYIRYAGQFEFNYPVLLSKLTARLSTIQNVLYIYQNTNVFTNLYNKYLFDGFYFIEPITSILPRALLGISATNFETIYVNIVTGEFNPGVIFYLGLFGKLLAYFNTGIYNFGNFFIVTFVLLGGLFILLKLNFKKAANPFIFYTIIQFALSGSIEELSYTLYGICLVLIFCKIRFGIHNENRY